MTDSETPEALVAEFITLSTGQLKKRLSDGHPIDSSALDGLAYRGISLGLPGWVEALTWKKFSKTFYRDPQTDELRGWNVRLVQNGLDAPDEAILAKGLPKTFGHYTVTDGANRRMPEGTDRGLLIDYGLSDRNPRLDFTRLLRDPIVAVEPGNHRVLLGWSYLDLFGLNISTPSFFLLVNPGPITHVPG